VFFFLTRDIFINYLWYKFYKPTTSPMSFRMLMLLSLLTDGRTFTSSIQSVYVRVIMRLFSSRISTSGFFVSLHLPWVKWKRSVLSWNTELICWCSSPQFIEKLVRVYFNDCATFWEDDISRFGFNVDVTWECLYPGNFKRLTEELQSGWLQYIVEWWKRRVRS